LRTQQFSAIVDFKSELGITLTTIYRAPLAARTFQANQVGTTILSEYWRRKMEHGTIKRITDKGFGFISSKNSSQDMFFHSSCVQGADFNDLREGQKVTYTIGQGPKGPRAENVQLSDD
jgi:cold shock protein